MRAIAIALATAAAPLGAQTSFWIDAGASRTRLAGSVVGSALSLGPVIRHHDGRLRLDASGNLSSFAGAMSGSGTVDLSLNATSFGALSIEVGGLAGGSAHSDATRTGQVLGRLRARMDGKRGGVWAGAGLGSTWDGAWRIVRQPETGAWVGGRAGTLSAGFTPTVVDDTIEYSDASATARTFAGPWEFSASLGARFGDQMPSIPADSRRWGSVGATLWLKPNAAVVASGGTYPVDFTQGFPGGRYVSLSLRLRAPRSEASSVDQASKDAGVDGFVVTTQSGYARVIRVRARNAQTVEISGDFTGWAPVSLRSIMPDDWRVVLPIEPGSHEVAIRVNGGPWLVPPRLTPLKDEFGGWSGLFVIRQAP